MKRTHGKVDPMRQWIADQVVPHLHADKLGGTTGEGARQTAQPRVPLQGNKASKPLAIKPVRVVVAGGTPSLTGEFVGETQRVLECTQTTHPRISTRRVQFACG